MDITVGRLSGGLLGDPMYLLAGGVGQIRATGVGVDDKAGRDNQSVWTTRQARLRASGHF